MGGERARPTAGGVGEAIDAAALKLAQGLRTLATVEFLLDEGGEFYFLEANPRLQVEHGVTEETTGLDLVRLQIALADGATLAALGLTPPPSPRGAAIEWRIVAEGAGRLARFRPPSGPGLRVDAGVVEGEEIALRYDPLLAKLIVRGADLADASRRSRRALGEWEIAGLATNLAKLRALADEDFANQVFAVDTLDRRFDASAPVASGGEIVAPLAGRLIEIAAAGRIAAGATVAVIEAMKMEHAVAAPVAGRFVVVARIGDVVAAGALLARIEMRRPPRPRRRRRSRSLLTRRAPISRARKPAGPPWTTPRGRRRSPSAMRSGCARRAKISPIWSIPARFRNTARSPWRRNDRADRSTTSSPTRLRTGSSPEPVSSMARSSARSAPKPPCSPMTLRCWRARKGCAATRKATG